MFAVDHAATALLIKRRYPSVPIAPILVSVQAMELAWVGLNYLGVERTTTEATVRSVADIHLAYMPYSHSVGTAVGAAVLAWLIVEKGLGRAALGRAIGLGIVSHLVLDLATHAHDIVLWPGSTTPKLGLGLYDAAPLGAFIVEFVYGIVCWSVYRGGSGLLAMISIGNLANLSFLSPAIPGPEQYLAGRPMLVVTVIFAQIVVTLVLVGVLSRRTTTRAGRRAPAGLVDPANTQLGVAKRVAGNIGYCLGLGPKSATREVAGSAFCPLTQSRRLLMFAGSTSPAGVDSSLVVHTPPRCISKAERTGRVAATSEPRDTR